MRLLLDNNVDQRFGALLLDHEVVHVRKIGFDRLQNGKLIAAAEEAGFEALITADKNMGYQQNITGRKISVVVLASKLITLRHIAPLAPKVLEVLLTLPSGAFVSVTPAEH